LTPFRLRRGRSLVRWRVAMWATLLALVAIPVSADVRDLLGRPITAVRIEVAGVPYTDPSVLQLFETRVGEPLSMERVRESIDHLVGLGRFEDIRVFADPAGPRAEGVAVRWVLVPVQRIASLAVAGNPSISAGALRAAIAEQFGTAPVTSRVPDIVEFVAAYYAERGYRRATVEPRMTPERSPELVTLHIVVDAGARASIRNVTTRGDADQTPATLIRELDLQPGSAYDAPAIEARVAAFEEELRALGYYEADIAITPTFADPEPAVDLVIDVRRGQRVRVVFAGDPLPAGRRDALVPIRQERSVDLDLLEDASRNIESFLRQEGYRVAEASYVREEKGGETVLTFTVMRGALYRLESLDVSGNSAVPRVEVLPLLALKPGEPFSDARVSTVATAVADLYRVRGFARVAVKPEVTILPPRREGDQQVRPVVVRLLVSEGPQTVVGEVTLSGVAALPEAKLTSVLGLTAGQPFYQPQLDADRDALERIYRNEGFQNARVDSLASARGDGTRVDVRWAIVEGPRVIVDRVLISGNQRTSEDLIRREIALKSGSPLGEDAVLESQRRLAALGLFRRVRIIELPHGASLTRDILIDVEEAPPTTIGYGGGLEAGRRLRTGEGAQAVEHIDVAPRAFFEVSRRNLWGKNRSMSFFTRVSLRPSDPLIEPEEVIDPGYGFNEYRVVGTFREPRPFDRQGDLQLTGFLEQAIRSSFNFRRRGVRVEYGRRFPGGLGVSGRYSLDRTRLFDARILPEDALNIDRLFPQVRLSMLTASVVRDTRNDPVDPAGGTLLGTDVSVALRAIGSHVGLVKSFTQGFVYRRLPGRSPFTVVAGARFGLAVGFARVLDDGAIVHDVPASERFFAGGDTTVRGFVLDRLGTDETLNSLGFPTGGNGLIVLNGELRTPYWHGLGAVGFLDAGNVFRRAGDIRLGEVRPAAGIGLRYRSPLGPLRVDFGFNLDPQTLPTGSRERTMVFHLSLGQAF
jgi:outer membrane protein insertion porin family